MVACAGTAVLVWLAHAEFRIYDVPIRRRLRQFVFPPRVYAAPVATNP
ncbi:MAG: hypothetical protein WA840_19975 [Caulobacteraceae bacterium]